MGSHEIEPQMDDDEQNSIDDSISDWTSLDPSSGNKDDAATSQVSFDDLDEMTVDMRFFAGSHSKTEVNKMRVCKFYVHTLGHAMHIIIYLHFHLTTFTTCSHRTKTILASREPMVISS